jgi:hypothetical protein
MTTSNTSNTLALGTAAQLCDYTAAVLAQMRSVVQPYVGAQQPDYAAHVGAHTRHIIEHYDTLVKAWGTVQKTPGVACHADYDARERNMAVETNPLEAIRRIGLIDAALGSGSGLNEADMLHTVHVYVRGGLQGEHNFCTPSTLAREIMFLNSHATHHFAIMQGYARERGQTLGAGVGKAPATVAYEQRANNTAVAA